MDEDEEISEEELINGTIEEINNGGCAYCNLKNLFDIAYNRGKKEILEIYNSLSDELLED